MKYTYYPQSPEKLFVYFKNITGNIPMNLLLLLVFKSKTALLVFSTITKSISELMFLKKDIFSPCFAS